MLKNLDCLTSEGLRQVQEFVDGIIQKSNEQTQFRAMLNNGNFSAIERFCYDELCIDAPVVPLSTYKDDCWWQRFRVPYGHNEPMTPVVLRGSRAAMTRRRSGNNGRGDWRLNEEIVVRWIRAKKLTCFDIDEFADFIFPAIQRLREKNKGMNTKNISSPSANLNVAYVGGVARYYTQAQFEYLSSLSAILRKTKKLEDRMDKLHQYREAA